MAQQVLKDASIPELPNHYQGKVRDCYDLPDGRRVMITTDRLSAFDRPIAAIPEKGRVLTKCADYWFRHTTDICPNHVIDYPDWNVLICKKLKMLPVEIVVRDYLTGATDTSLLSMYLKGNRMPYGYALPDDMQPHQQLAYPLITPTTKSDDHDQPLNAWQVVDQDLLTVDQWKQICRISFALFERCRERVRKNGLILADTKYEFGLDENGVITLADEIHTPDSSRYWFANTYEARLKAGLAPESFDKDVIRRWISERCDPYHDPIPEIPAEIIEQTSNVYIGAYEKITGLFHTPFTSTIPIMNRIRAALHTSGVLEISQNEALDHLTADAQDMDIY